MRLPRLKLALATLAVPVLAAAQSTTPGTSAAVTVTASRAVGELPYRYFIEMQHHLERYLPPGPRLVDLWFRVGAPGMSEAERDVHQPQGWAIAVRSRSVDFTVPLRRGAYFSLPEIQDAYDERGEIVVNGTYRPWLSIWWSLRVPESRRMAWADILAARAQIKVVQRRISAFAAQLQHTRRSPYDGIKACFLDGGGAILVDGVALADAVEGDCKVLFLDRDGPARGEVVEFAGQLHIVSFVDRRYYNERN